MSNNKQKFSFIAQLVCDIFNLRILHSDWSRGFWNTTQQPDFSQKVGFLQKVRGILVFSYSRKTGPLEWNILFSKDQKSHFWTLLARWNLFLNQFASFFYLTTL